MKTLNMIVLFLYVGLNTSQGQELKKQKISNEDLRKGILAYYEYKAQDSYGYVGLTLFKSGKYYYKMETFGRGSFSEGKWRGNGREIILTSDLKKNNLPVKLTYLNDTSNSKSSFSISVVKNWKGELITDAFVYVNNDTLQCLPLTETCLGSFGKINRLKVVFENGLSSKWVKVEDKEYKQLQLILQLDFQVSTYETFENDKYKVFSG